jgi:hypothetical protein
MHIHTYIHTNSPTITHPSLSYFLFPRCLSVLSLSLEKLWTCGVIRSSNFRVYFENVRPLQSSALFSNMLKCKSNFHFRYSIARFLSTTFPEWGRETRKHRPYFRDSKNHDKDTGFTPESVYACESQTLCGWHDEKTDHGHRPHTEVCALNFLCLYLIENSVGLKQGLESAMSYFLPKTTTIHAAAVARYCDNPMLWTLAT